VCAESVAINARSDEDTVLLPGEVETELSLVGRVEAVGAVSGSASAVVVPARGADTGGGDGALVVERVGVATFARSARLGHDLLAVLVAAGGRGPVGSAVIALLSSV
jgi:hypothetical protein